MGEQFYFDKFTYVDDFGDERDIPIKYKRDIEPGPLKRITLGGFKGEQSLKRSVETRHNLEPRKLILAVPEWDREVILFVRTLQRAKKLVELPDLVKPYKIIEYIGERQK